MLIASNKRQFLEAHGAIRDFIDTMISGEDTWVYGVIRSNNIFNSEDTNVLIQLAILKPLDEFLPILDAIYGGYKTSTEVQGFLDSLAMLCGACHQSGVNKFLFNNLCVGEPPVQEIQQYIIQLRYDEIKTCSFQQVQNLLKLITQARADSSWMQTSVPNINAGRMNTVQVARMREFRENINQTNAIVAQIGLASRVALISLLTVFTTIIAVLVVQEEQAKKRGEPENPDGALAFLSKALIKYYPVLSLGVIPSIYIIPMVFPWLTNLLVAIKASSTEARLQDLLQQIPGNEQVFQELQPLLTAADGVLPLQVLFSTEAENAALVQRLSAGSTVVAQALAMPFQQAQSAPQVEVTTQAQANPK